jgi:hypothetical protein
MGAPPAPLPTMMTSKLSIKTGLSHKERELSGSTS